MSDIDRMQTSNRKISFAWNIHFKCNYRCPYCWFHGSWQELSKSDRSFSAEEIVRCWTNIYKNYGSVHIDILGGEPFIYPNFREIVRDLSNLHTINISTNLSIDIEKFAKEINPSRVKIMPSFHLLFADLDKFLRQLDILKVHGFDGGASYLAYPPQLKLWKYYKQEFESASFSLGLMPFWGKYNEIDYPQGYTDLERQMIRPYLGKRADEFFQLTPKKIKKGSLCRAGQIYAVIHSDGGAKKCGMDSAFGSLGNIFDGSFKLFDKPTICTAEYCPCNESAFLLIENRSPSKLKSKKELAPKFPRRDPPFKVHWNWEITYKCNYQCSYCHFWKEDENVYSHIGVDRWVDIWSHIFYKCGCGHIRFSGGEPTVYPNFFDLVSRLANWHTIDITTNLSFDLNQLINKVKPGPLFISPSFHPEFDDIDDFIRKILLLRKNGFSVNDIAYVAYPPHLAKMMRIMKATEEQNIEFKIIPFHGEFEARKYPQGYTDEEKKLLKEAAENSMRRDLNIRWQKWHVREDKSYEEDSKVKKNNSHLCRMGQMYAKIFPDGKVTRCCSPQSDLLGNIFDENFRILDEPMICNVEHCPCFKAMFVGEEQSWMQHWGSPEHPQLKNV